MTILVDVGITTGAADTSAYWFIGNPTRGKIGTAAIAPADLITPVGDRLMSLNVQRTSDRTVGPVVQYNAGTATLTLLNDDGLLDPVNLIQVPVGADLRIRNVAGGVTYPVFRGTVTSWLPVLHSPTHATISVQAVDAFDDLANNRPFPLGSPVGPGEDTGARINRILDAIAWPVADRSIAVGNSALAGTLLDADALTLAQSATEAEVGEFYIDADGVTTFRNRYAVLNEARSNTSQATFGTGPGEIPYVGTPGVSNDRGQMFNTVRASRTGGTSQSASDAASIARNRERVSPERSNLPLQTDSEALSWAKYVLGTVANPELRFSSLQLDTRADPAVYPQALGRLFGDRVTVVRRPPGVVDSRELYIRGIEHTWSPPDRWLTTWALESVIKYSFWTIGHPTLGRIGSNAIAL